MTVTISADEARRHLLEQTGLARPSAARGKAAIRRMLGALRCIQLDPLDPMGTNADLVTFARVDGALKGDVHRALLPRHAFEHFAKERCILPASAFPQYRDHAIATPWWRLTERSKRVPSKVIEAVLEEITARGPSTAAELADHGSVRPLDWSGWKGTGRMTTMALEILWTRCRVVVAGRAKDGTKIYDLPERALPAHHDAPALEHGRWAVLERVEAAGLLARAGGPCWSMLRDVRTSGRVDALIEEGAIEEVVVEGSARPYLAPKGFRDRVPARERHDDRMRILAPLDPVLWDRKLVSSVFGFEYVWEVYKPAKERRWGWYVCPLLHHGRLVGRLEARVRERALVVDRVWREDGARFDEDALDAALARHAESCGVDGVKRLRGARRR